METLRIRGVPGRTLLGCGGGWFGVLELDVLLWVASSGSAGLVVFRILTWRWPGTAETCRHCRTNKLRYLDSCVLTDLPTLISIKHNGDDKPENCGSHTLRTVVLSQYPQLPILVKNLLFSAGNLRFFFIFQFRSTEKALFFLWL